MSGFSGINQFGSLTTSNGTKIDYKYLVEKYDADGNGEISKDEFNTALIINPRYYQAYNALGVIELNTGNLNKARQYFGKALEIDPNYATAIDNLGTVDYLQGNLDLAQKRFLKAISINPNSSTAYFHMAQIYDKNQVTQKPLMP